MLDERWLTALVVGTICGWIVMLVGVLGVLTAGKDRQALARRARLWGLVVWLVGWALIESASPGHVVTFALLILAAPFLGVFFLSLEDRAHHDSHDPEDPG